MHEPIEVTLKPGETILTRAAVIDYGRLAAALNRDLTRLGEQRAIEENDQ